METNLQQNPSGSYFKPIIGIVLTGIVLNLAAVNYVLYKNAQPKPIAQIPPSPSVAATASPGCDILCVRTVVREATASIKIASPTTTKATSTIVQPTAVSTPRPRELFVDIGSGATAAGDWTSVDGLQVTLSRANYPGLKEAYFEATLSVPSSDGLAYARLYNLSDGKPLENSDVSTTNSSPQLVTSLPITLEGTKLYQVQLKSSLMKDIKLTQSRIKIIY